MSKSLIHYGRNCERGNFHKKIITSGENEGRFVGEKVFQLPAGTCITIISYKHGKNRDARRRELNAILVTEDTVCLIRAH